MTRAIGAGIFVAPRRLFADLPVAALREDVVTALFLELEPLFADALLLAVEALRALLPAPADADRLRDFVLFDLFLLPPRVEAVLPDFPRDFLALVAIDALLGVVDRKTISTIARIRHIRKAFGSSHCHPGQAFRIREPLNRTAARCPVSVWPVQSSRVQLEQL